MFLIYCFHLSENGFFLYFWVYVSQWNKQVPVMLPGMVDGLGSQLLQRRQLYAGPLSKLRMLMICRMAKPEEVLIVEDENGNIVRETMKDNDVLVQYKVIRWNLISASVLCVMLSCIWGKKVLKPFFYVYCILVDGLYKTLSLRHFHESWLYSVAYQNSTNYTDHEGDSYLLVASWPRWYWKAGM